jgi:hypothetical protein
MWRRLSRLAYLSACRELWLSSERLPNLIAKHVSLINPGLQQQERSASCRGPSPQTFAYLQHSITSIINSTVDSDGYPDLPPTILLCEDPSHPATTIFRPIAPLISVRFHIRSSPDSLFPTEERYSRCPVLTIIINVAHKRLCRVDPRSAERSGSPPAKHTYTDLFGAGQHLAYTHAGQKPTSLPHICLCTFLGRGQQGREITPFPMAFM